MEGNDSPPPPPTKKTTSNQSLIRHLNSMSTTPSPGFSAEQWKALVTVFSTLPPYFNRLHDKWIIDTGCNHHVTGDLTYLSELRDVSPCSVGLTHGQNILSLKEGIVTLTDKVILHHVLYVPQLACNLISASQLSDDMHCEFITNSDSCVIQDRRTREVIGTGDRKDGLYYFREETIVKIVSVAASTSMELWHSRLGHPSEKVIKCLPFLGNSGGTLNKACEVCHPAKQSRKFFSISHVNRTDYQLIDISEDGFISLLTENGNTKDDLRLPTDEEHHFEGSGDAGASKTFSQQAGTIRKNGFIVIKGRPCKLLCGFYTK